MRDLDLGLGHDLGHVLAPDMVRVLVLVLDPDRDRDLQADRVMKEEITKSPQKSPR